MVQIKNNYFHGSALYTSGRHAMPCRHAMLACWHVGMPWHGGMAWCIQCLVRRLETSHETSRDVSKHDLRRLETSRDVSETSQCHMHAWDVSETSLRRLRDVSCMHVALRRLWDVSMPNACMRRLVTSHAYIFLGSKCFRIFLQWIWL